MPHDCRVDDALTATLRAHRPADADETADLERILTLLEDAADPWSRGNPLHLTSSALVLHPPTRRVLLRWHAKQQRWLQVGGHADPGERDPWAIALREAREETALTDLRPAQDGLAQVAIVDVVAAGDEPAHHHADLRYFLVTDRPDDVPAEVEGVPLRWMTLDEALDVADDGLERLLRRVPGFG
jgi:8-oxo-dGTP pyrophosphatase MutT (NUDIX family)